MSADYWRVCPACVKRIDKLNEARINAPGQAYGKVARDVYEKLLDAAKNLVQPQETLREDYDIGIRDGEFYVDYMASCQECNFHFSYSVKETIKKI